MTGARERSSIPRIRQRKGVHGDCGRGKTDLPGRASRLVRHSVSRGGCVRPGCIGPPGVDQSPQLVGYELSLAGALPPQRPVAGRRRTTAGLGLPHGAGGGGTAYGAWYPRRISGVRADSGFIGADAVVIAGGVDTGTIGGRWGVNVPLRPAPGGLAYTSGPAPDLPSIVAGPDVFVIHIPVAGTSWAGDSWVGRSTAPTGRAPSRRKPSPSSRWPGHASSRGSTPASMTSPWDGVPCPRPTEALPRRAVRLRGASPTRALPGPGCIQGMPGSNEPGRTPAHATPTAAARSAMPLASSTSRSPKTSSKKAP